ncbi:MM3350-like domain-containing protein [Fimicolochytrium jonesii]|uniref:MM3350-like domain-containing protein n=1 Tax=Fimicolochytrium jonesii TaxID=1396493 RepID=UPI0022FDED81|nr:MM3350-like domain-containing protein [Fimicolochytrium jonesii]KAI8825703.1 MM3350-like domain-containing protein [Fimicolochytrium jonesii]
MTVDAVKIVARLPAGIRAAGVDNAAVVKLRDEYQDALLANSDVFPEPGAFALVSLFFEEDSNKKVTLRGPVGAQQTVELASGQGVDFAYEFQAKQHKVFEDEAEFEGFWKGLLRFSRFRWVVAELSESTEAEYKAAEEKAIAAANVKETDGAKLHEQGVAAMEAGNFNEALTLFTRAFKTCELPEEALENDDSEDPHAALRLQVLGSRAKASFQLKAYTVAVRDGEMVERIYGRPVEALDSLDQTEAGFYFQSVLTSAEANRALGNRIEAGSGYMAIMLLKMIEDQRAEIQAEAGQTLELPVAPELAKTLTEAASAQLAALNMDENSGTIYSLKISLVGVTPEVWRTIEVTGHTTLGDLREYITMAFGWCGAPNTHEFEVYDHGIVRFTTIPDNFVIPDEEEEFDERHEICEDEDLTNVAMVASKVGDTFTYIYEKGDWVHQVTVEEIREETLNDDCCAGHDDEENEDKEHEHEHTSEYPKVIGGARACPPDEVGGPAGYAQFLQAVSGTPTERFPDRISALNFAKDNIGFSNNALDSWGGSIGKRSLDAIIEEVDEDEEEVVEAEKTPADLEKGGWDAEAFILDEAQKCLATIAAMLENGDDDEEEWEDDEEEEDEDL